MQRLISKFKIDVNRHTYIKDPDSSDLGRSILSVSISMIYENGFEDFTFKKLGQQINSTETSVYRYFENKHKLLLYITNWYWGFIEYQLVFETANISSPEERLKNAIRVITSRVNEDYHHPYIDFKKLHHIVISDSAKTFLSANVDEDRKAGVFEAYVQLFERIASIIREVNPEYNYPKMLISSVIEGAHFQQYFMEYIPSLTDHINEDMDITKFYTQLVMSALGKK